MCPRCQCGLHHAFCVLPRLLLRKLPDKRSNKRSQVGLERMIKATGKLYCKIQYKKDVVGKTPRGADAFFNKKLALACGVGLLQKYWFLRQGAKVGRGTTYRGSSGRPLALKLDIWLLSVRGGRGGTGERGIVNHVNRIGVSVGIMGSMLAW